MKAEPLAEQLSDLLTSLNQYLNELHTLREKVIDLIRSQSSVPGANEDLKIGKVHRIEGTFQNDQNRIALAYFGADSNGTLGHLVLFKSYVIWIDVAGEIKAVFWGLSAAKKQLRWIHEAELIGF
jgi:hypothetical protein